MYYEDGDTNELESMYPGAIIRWLKDEYFSECKAYDSLSKDMVADIVLKAGSYTNHIDEIMLVDNKNQGIMPLKDFAHELLNRIVDAICEDFEVYQ